MTQRINEAEMNSILKAHYKQKGQTFEGIIGSHDWPMVVSVEPSVQQNIEPVFGYHQPDPPRHYFDR